VEKEDRIIIHPHLDLVTALRWEDFQNDVVINAGEETRVGGNFQFIAEKRFSYASQLRLHSTLVALFPHIPISLSTFYNRTVNLNRPIHRSDMCSLCLNAEALLEKMNRMRVDEDGLSDLEKQQLDRFRQHRKLATERRLLNQTHIAQLQFNECVIIVDHKENFVLPIERDQPGQSFYENHSVTCLSFVCYFGCVSGSPKKRVITILSSIVTHSANTVVSSMHKAFSHDLFSSITHCRWWSDGAPHFKNGVVIGSMLHPEKRIAGFSFDVHFFVPAHGKSECDSVFAYYTNIPKSRVTKDGIRDLQTLKESLELFTLSDDTAKMREATHTFLLLSSSDCFAWEETMIIPNLSSQLSFYRTMALPPDDGKVEKQQGVKDQSSTVAPLIRMIRSTLSRWIKISTMKLTPTDLIQRDACKEIFITRRNPPSKVSGAPSDSQDV